MRTLFMLSTVLFHLAPAYADDTAAATGTTLTLRVEGIATDKGHILCTLYGSAETWLQDPGYHATTSAKPVKGVATCAFTAIPPGTWAVSFIHDVNDNEDMDVNFFGLPKEPWGMSRDAPVRFSPPTFEDAAFQHPSPTLQIAHLR